MSCKKKTIEELNEDIEKFMTGGDDMICHLRQLEFDITNVIAIKDTEKNRQYLETFYATLIKSDLAKKSDQLLSLLDKLKNRCEELKNKKDSFKNKAGDQLAQEEGRRPIQEEGIPSSDPYRRQTSGRTSEQPTSTDSGISVGSSIQSCGSKIYPISEEGGDRVACEHEESIKQSEDRGESEA